MIVRCGSCRSELEVSGPGEFTCPACGTRNAVRAPAAAPAPSGLTVPGGMPPPPASPAAPSDVRWGQCPACAYRFATGTVTALACPMCAASLERRDDGSLALSG